MNRRFRRLIAPLILIILTFTTFVPSAAPASAAGGPVFSSPKQYYLSLGDSIAYGYRQARLNALVKSGHLAASDFIGVSNYFERMLAAIDPKVTLVNYSCVGETSASFSATCPYATTLPRHDPYIGSQLDAALAFLKVHRGQVGTITLDIGANDAGAIIARCGGLQNLQCLLTRFPGQLEQLQANINNILASLRAAAPNAEIIVLQLYNPYAAVNPTTDLFVQAANKAIAIDAAANRAYVANAFKVFNASGKQPHRLCKLTGFCTSLRDIHPSPAGYLRLAQTYWDASGYARLGGGATMISFTGAKAGRGEVRFGLTCRALSQATRRDLLSRGKQHIVYIPGAQLQRAGVSMGRDVRYRDETITATGLEVDNGGTCYRVKRR
jgi:lysophospholipase L1-like esterase